MTKDVPASPAARPIKTAEAPLASEAAKGGIAASAPQQHAAPEAPLTAGDKIGDGLPPMGTPPAPLRPAYKAYAVIPLGHDNFWELQEVILDPNNGTFKVARRTIPNTKDICTGRAISCLDGVDGFEYGSSVS